MQQLQRKGEDIVIIGGGIFGLSCAYYLLTSPLFPAHSTVTLVESSAEGIAKQASGNAGGFISKTWHSNPTMDLARLSYEAHTELAALLDGARTYGWRESGAVGLTVGNEQVEKSAYRLLPRGSSSARSQESDWLNGTREDLSEHGGIAQLDPALFCQHLYAHCTKLGLITHFAQPLSSLSPSSKSITLRPLSNPRSIFSLRYTKLVICAGPWSAAVCETLSFGSLPLSNLPGHSILIRPALDMIGGKTELPSEAVFAGISGAERGVHASTSGIARSLTAAEVKQGFTRSPEFFPRSNGLVYVAGENSIPSAPAFASSDRISGQNLLPNLLPDSPDGVKLLLDQRLIGRLITSAAMVSPALDVKNGAVVEREQFCYRPVTPDGDPIIDRLREDVYVATGAGPWGITLAPGAGKLIAEMILSPLGSVLSADVSGLTLQRFRALEVTEEGRAKL